MPSLARWLPPALALLAGCHPADPPAPGPSSPRFVFVAEAPAVELGRLRPASGRVPPPQLVTLGRGWSFGDDRFLWATETTAELELRLDRSQRTLVFDLEPPPPEPGLRRTQRVTIAVNGHEVATVSPSRWVRRHRIELPEGLVPAGPATVSWRFDFLVRPRAAGGGADLRPLAGGVRRVALDPDPGAGRSMLDRADRPPAHLDPTSGRLSVDRAGRLLLPIEDLGAPLRLEVPPSAASGCTAGWADGQGRALGPALPCPEADDGLSRPPDQAEFLELRVVRSPLEAVVALARLPSVARWPEVEPPPADPSPPDLVLLVLDAARPDHFGYAGYPRPTTPFLDQLARESLVFSQAVAQAPYTACSMPTLLSGLSFTRHGVVDLTDRLAPEIVTLAEQLRDAGYRTIGFSGTPNNSSRNGLEQGFEELHEVWNELPPDERFDPHRMTEVVTDRLAMLADDRPLFLMVHYVPPHEPYTPGPPFDLFTDPSYAGPIDGRGPSLRALREGLLHLREVDRRHLVDLYDGNLRAADDAVGRLVDTLRSRPRWKDTVVVVTADHGEAFFEHDLQGHNLTLFEEMIRVPLLLRLPADHPANGAAPDALDLDRLVSLEDVAPTLLRLAGLRPRPDVTGLDLLDATGTRSHVVLRIGGPPVVHGLRTERFKLVADGGTLFDLAADPDEREDLAADHPWLTAGLTLELQRALESDAVAASAAGLDPAQQEALRSLGYLD